MEEPELVHRLLTDPRAGWLWLVLRVWLGWQWIQAAEQKIYNSDWVGTGVALKSFWETAVAVPQAGQPAVAFDWYRSFLQSLLDSRAYTWFGPLVAYGELLVGITLILGVFTGFAAFFGALMNWNLMMAGSASSNPVLLIIAIGLVMAWKVAGYIGLDYFVLPLVGTPWQRLQRPAEHPDAMTELTP